MNDYKRWLAEAKDKAVHDELVKMDDNQIESSFYKDLEFGTGGLRGIIGAGSNRLNIYTVGKISQGIANYLVKNFAHPSIAVSYDSRINSTLFAEYACRVYAANGIKVHLYKVLMPTPCLSYAVRYLKCSAGIMITASHNPKEYNGYKVYNDSGCQITLEAANEISSYIEKIDVFSGVKLVDFEAALKKKDITYIGDDCLDSFIKYSEKKVLPAIKDRDLKIIYSPLNGTGLVPVTRALKEAGFASISVVKEQEFPDGNFTTCPRPNPELKEALTLGIKELKAQKADLLLVTDPDCDRCGTAVLENGEARLISGNEMGILLYDFLLKFKKTVPGSEVIKTIVTTDMIFPMAKKAKMAVKEVLTGFKFIGEQIGLLEKEGHPERFFFGFEESYGYLSDTGVRDKDAVDASLIIAQMMQYYKSIKKDPLERLEELYQEFGYSRSALDTFEFTGPVGAKKMAEIMAKLHEDAKGNTTYEFINDYLAQKHYEKGQVTPIDLPSSDVLKFGYADGSTITIRPSGTEPKLKVYYYVVTPKEKELAAKLVSYQTEIKNILKDYL